MNKKTATAHKNRERILKLFCRKYGRGVCDGRFVTGQYHSAGEWISLLKQYSAEQGFRAMWTYLSIENLEKSGLLETAEGETIIIIKGRRAESAPAYYLKMFSMDERCSEARVHNAGLRAIEALVSKIVDKQAAVNAKCAAKKSKTSTTETITSSEDTAIVHTKKKYVKAKAFTVNPVSELQKCVAKCRALGMNVHVTIEF